MRLELGRRAQADLDDIRDHGVARFGTARAIIYLDRIEQTFRQILAHPRIGVVRSDLGAVRSLSSGEHRVYYRVAAETIVIVRVLHKAMDVEWHL